MDLVWTVNRVSQHAVPVEVPFKGDVAMMMMTITEIEMFDPAGVHGTVCLRLSGKAEEEAGKEFVQGATVKLPLGAFVVTPPAAEAEPVAA